MDNKLSEIALSNLLSTIDYWEELLAADTKDKKDALCRKVFLDGWSKCVKTYLIDESI